MFVLNLSKNKKTILDNKDFLLYKKWKWYCSANGYAVRNNIRIKKKWYLHRLIMNVEQGLEIDHINGDKLDNRKINLRICTRSQNRQNSKIPNSSTSGYKGVIYLKKMLDWKNKSQRKIYL